MPNSVRRSLCEYMEWMKDLEKERKWVRLEREITFENVVYIEFLVTFNAESCVISIGCI